MGANEFRSAMSRLASAVSIVTTLDQAGRLWGFTASSVCSVSLNPPLILVCIDRRARSHQAFRTTRHFAVSVLKRGQEPIAERFATPRNDKFAGGHVLQVDGRLPVIRGALVHLECGAYNVSDGGDHTIVVGQVQLLSAGAGQPLVYFNRAFWGVALG